MKGQDLPITGGLAAACAFAVLVIKLVTKGDADRRWFQVQTLLLGLGATLYIVPYLLGVQVTQVGSSGGTTLASIFVSSQNTNWSLPLCYISALIVGALGLVAVAFNLRETVSRPRGNA